MRSPKPKYAFKKQALRRRQGKAQEHENLINKVFENPGLLGIEGLDSQSVVYRKVEPKRISGKPIIDLVIVYVHNDSCIILLAEAKAGLFKGLKKGDYQLHQAFKLIRNPLNWTALIRKILSLGIELNPEWVVWLDTIEFYEEFGRKGKEIHTTKPIRYQHKRTRLGLVSHAVEFNKDENNN